MSRSLKPKNNEYIDSTGIVHDRELLSEILQENAVIVSTEEPSENNRKKVWLKHSSNLFDGNYVLGYVASNNTYYASANTRSAIIPVMPNTKYSVKKFNSSDRFAIAESSVYPQAGTTVNTLFADASATYATVTTSSTAKYLIVYVSNTNETPNLEIDLGEIVPTTYTPYVYDKEYILNSNDIYEEFKEEKLMLEAEDIVSLESGVATNVATAKITAPKDGLALVIVHAVFSGTGGGSRYVNIGVISGDITPKANMQVPSGNIGIGISSMRILDLKAGNIIAPRIEQTSGSSMNVTCRIQVCYL